MKVSEITGLIGGNKGTRKDKDFYPTPGYVIDALLDREIISGSVWEPACGDGAIAKKLLERGHFVHATDLYDHGYGYTGYDFLKEQTPAANIITNPPFNLSTKFALHGLRLAQQKLILLNKLTFLEGKERRDKLFSQNKLEKIYIFSERVNFEDPSKKGGMLCFAWFVFDVRYNGKPRLEWI